MIGIFHHALLFIALILRQIRFPSIKLQVQKVTIVMLETKLGMTEHGSKKGFVRHNHVLDVIQILMDKGPWFGPCQVFREFATNNPPLTARKQIGSSRRICQNGQIMDSMHGIVAFHKVIPQVGTVGFHDNVQKVGIQRKRSEPVSNFGIRSQGIRCRSQMHHLVKVQRFC